eukprot:144326-Pyramimonas_sp.AAC.1
MARIPAANVNVMMRELAAIVRIVVGIPTCSVAVYCNILSDRWSQSWSRTASRRRHGPRRS